MAKLGSIGSKVDLVIVTGTAFGPHHVTLTNPDTTPVDLTGCALRGQIRRTPEFDGELLMDVIVSNRNDAQGKFDISLGAADTAQVEAGGSPGDVDSMAEWDFEMVDASGRPQRLYYGTVSFYRGITKPNP